MLVQSPLLRREKRPEIHRLVHLGVMTCVWATGLVEFLALQRSRFQRQHHRAWDADQASDGQGS